MNILFWIIIGFVVSLAVVLLMMKYFMEDVSVPEPKRPEETSFERYRRERKEEQKRIKRILRGYLIWDSGREGPADRFALAKRSQTARGRS